MFPYFLPYKRKLIGSILFSFVLAGIKGYQAMLFEPIVTKGLSPDSSMTSVIQLILTLIALGIINFPARFFHFYWIRFTVDRIACDIRSEIYKKFQKLPMSFYADSKQGELISGQLNDTILFASGFRSVVDFIREPLTAICTFCVALWQDWQLTMVIVVASPAFIYIFNKTGKKIHENQTKVQEKISIFTHNITEGIAGQKITKAFNLQNYTTKRFESSQDSFFTTQMRSTFIEEIAHPLVEFIVYLAISGVIFFAHYRVASGALTTGGFISFIAAMIFMMEPIRKYSQSNVRLNQAKAAAERIFKLLALPEEVDVGEVDKIDFVDQIEIDNISFAYKDHDVISNLSMSVKKGQKVALVGLSGSGKSTLINLLLGLYPIERGQIKIDGINSTDIKLTSLRGLFSLVSQDIFLLHDSILENLTLGKNITQEQIDEALQVAYATEFINKLPDQLKTTIGDRGSKLSGGQQQRLTIARAFIQNSEILLFDEATSALDNESEKIVQAALDDLGHNKTVIAVAHRLSTIQHFDQIFVFHEGRLLEQGVHQQLLELGGEYHKLYELSKSTDELATVQT